jgi:hypothetical protein
MVWWPQHFLTLPDAAGEEFTFVLQGNGSWLCTLWANDNVPQYPLVCDDEQTVQRLWTEGLAVIKHLGEDRHT